MTKKKNNQIIIYNTEDGKTKNKYCNRETKHG